MRHEQERFHLPSHEAEQDPTLGERAAELAKAVLTTIGIKVAPPRGKKELPEESGYLVFLSNLQI